MQAAFVGLSYMWPSQGELVFVVSQIVEDGRWKLHFILQATKTQVVMMHASLHASDHILHSLLDWGYGSFQEL